MSAAKRNMKYVSLDGSSYALSGLDAEERAALDRIQAEARNAGDWGLFGNFWRTELTKLYKPRGLSPREITETVLWDIAADLTGRLGIAQGQMRQSDYRDDLELLILRRFGSRREFCQRTGLSEDMLSHVLARRKHLSMDTLTDVLAKVGYAIHIVPVSDQAGSS